jgi:hypothetical protein
MTIAEDQPPPEARPIRTRYVVIRYTSPSDVSGIRYRPSPLDKALTLDIVRERLAKDEIMYHRDTFQDADGVIIPRAVERSYSLLDIVDVRIHSLSTGRNRLGYSFWAP